VCEYPECQREEGGFKPSAKDNEKRFRSGDKIQKYYYMLLPDMNDDSGDCQEEILDGDGDDGRDYP